MPRRFVQGASSVHAYFPAGVWYDAFTHAQLRGGRSHSLEAPLGSVPVHFRGGSIVPLQRPGLTSAAVRRSPFTLVVALPALVRPAPLILVKHCPCCGGEYVKWYAVAENVTFLSLHEQLVAVESGLNSEFRRGQRKLCICSTTLFCFRQTIALCCKRLWVHVSILSHEKYVMELGILYASWYAGNSLLLHLLTVD